MRTIPWILSLLAVCSCAGAARGEVIPVTPPERDPGEFDLAPPIEEDVAVQRLIEKAKRYYDEGDYKRAIDLLQPVLLQPASSYFTADGRTYYPVTQFVREMIETLPPPGLDLYRATYDPLARRLFDGYEETGSTRLLDQLNTRYFASSLGYEAADRLALRYLDSCQFLRAANLWQELLDLRRHEGSGLAGARTDDDWDAAELWVKIATAYCLGGEPRRATRALEEAEALAVGERVKFGGRRRKVADLREAPPFAGRLVGGASPLTNLDDSTPGSLGALSWLQPGGNARHNRRPLDVSAELQGVRDWYLPLLHYRAASKTPDPQNRFGNPGFFGGSYQPPDQLGNKLVPRSQPAIAEGLFLYRDNGKLVAAELDSGKRRWAAVGTGSNFSDASTIAWGTHGDGAGTGVAVSPHHRLVFVVDESIAPKTRRALPDYNPWGGGGQAPASRILANELHAYDLTNGKLRWRWDYKRDGHERPVYLRTTPMLDGEMLYVLGESDRELAVYAFEAATGRLEWWTPIAVNNAWGNSSEGRRWEADALAVAQGVVVAQTNLGVVVGVDAGGGGVLWITRYERLTRVNSAAGRGRMVMPGQPPPPPTATGWAAGRPVISGERVVVAPADATELQCLDLRRGTLQWKYAKTRDVDSIYGADATRVVLGGRRVVALELATGQTAWESAYVAMTSPGRGLVTGREVVQPTETGFARFGRDTGKLLELVSLPGVEADGGGNLLVTDGRLVVVTDSRAHAFSSVAAAERELTLRIESDPGKPEYRYRRGRLYMRSDRFDEAMADLERAYELGEVVADLGVQLDSAKSMMDAIIERIPAHPQGADELVARGLELLRRVEGALALLEAQPTLREQLLERLPDREEAAIDAELEAGGTAVGLVLGLITPADYEIAFSAVQARALHATGRTPESLGILFGLLRDRESGLVEARPGWRLDLAAFVQGILGDIAATGGTAAFAPYESELDAQLALAEPTDTEAALAMAASIEDIYVRHRASPRASQLLWRLADSYETAGDLDACGRALRRIVRNHGGAAPGSVAEGLHADAMARLVELGLADGRRHRAAATAIALAQAHPDRKAWVDDALRREELSDYAGFVPEPEASGLRGIGELRWSIDQPEARIVDVTGPRSPEFSGNVLVQVGGTLQRRSLATGEVLDEVKLLGVTPRRTEGFYLDYFLPSDRRVSFLGTELVYTSVFAANVVDWTSWELLGATKLVNVLSARKLDDLRVKLLTGRNSNRNHYDRYAFLADTLVVVSSSRKVTAVRPPFADELWKSKLSDWPFGDPVPWGDDVAVITNPRSLTSSKPSRLFFVDAATGDIQEAASFERRITEQPHVTADGMMLLPQAGSVRALSLEKRETLWTRRFGRETCRVLGSSGENAVVDSDRGFLLVTRTTDGSVQAQIDVGRLRRTLAARIEGNKLYVMSARPAPGTVRGLDCMRDGTLAAYDLATGKRDWQTRIRNQARLAFVDMRLAGTTLALLVVSGKSIEDDRVTTSEASVTRTHAVFHDLGSGAMLQEHTHELAGDGPAPKLRITPEAVLLQTGGGLQVHSHSGK